MPATILAYESTPGFLTYRIKSTERECSILTTEISKATIEMTPTKYQKLKGLKKENLRDQMNDMELIFTMLGEASTTRIARFGILQLRL